MPQGFIPEWRVFTEGTVHNYPAHEENRLSEQSGGPYSVSSSEAIPWRRA